LIRHFIPPGPASNTASALLQPPATEQIFDKDLNSALGVFRSHKKGAAQRTVLIPDLADHF
jgi:hypothetical protein